MSLSREEVLAIDTLGAGIARRVREQALLEVKGAVGSLGDVVERLIQTEVDVVETRLIMAAVDQFVRAEVVPEVNSQGG